MNKNNLIESIILCVEDDTDRNFTTEEKIEMIQFLRSLEDPEEVKHKAKETSTTTQFENPYWKDEGPNWMSFVEKLKKNIIDLSGAKSYYLYPKTKEGWEKIRDAFKNANTDDLIDIDEKKQRLTEYQYSKEDYGGEFGYLFEDGASMELGFECVEFVDLPIEMQLASIEIDWVAIEN